MSPLGVCTVLTMWSSRCLKLGRRPIFAIEHAGPHPSIELGIPEGWRGAGSTMNATVGISGFDTGIWCGNRWCRHHPLRPFCSHADLAWLEKLVCDACPRIPSVECQSYRLDLPFEARADVASSKDGNAPFDADLHASIKPLQSLTNDRCP